MKTVPLLMKDGTLTIYFAYSGDLWVGMGGLYNWDCCNADKGRSDFSKGYYYTIPEFRKQGVMHHIMELMIKTAEERGCGCVHIFTANEYRQSLYEIGFRDIIDIDEGGIFVNGDEMEIPKNKYHGTYHNLQPLRIPAGWSIVYNRFEDIELESVSDSVDKVWQNYFDKEILYMRSEISSTRDGKTEKQLLQIALDWYPDGDPDGKFYLQAVLDRDWYEPLLGFSSRSKEEIVNTLEEWLFVEFMPRRFIDEDDFRKKHGE